MRVNDHNPTARSAITSTRSTESSNDQPSVFEPLVGKPWPSLSQDDVNCAEVKCESKVSEESASYIFALRFQLKTRVVFIGVLAIAIGYAMHIGDRGMVNDILGVLKAMVPNLSITKSPP